MKPTTVSNALLIFILGASLSLVNPAGAASIPPAPSVVYIERTFDSAMMVLMLTESTGCPYPVILNGTAVDRLFTTAGGAATDHDGDGREQVDTEFTQLTLEGMCPGGAVSVSLRSIAKSPFTATLGEMEEQVNNTSGTLDLAPFTATGTADSFFDVYLEIQVQGQTFHNLAPLTIFGIFPHSPPYPGNHFAGFGPIQLYDESDVAATHQLLSLVYYPIAIGRYFPQAMAVISFTTPNGLVGPFLLHGTAADFLSTDNNGQASDTDLDGLDQVKMGAIYFELSGRSPYDEQVTVRLRSQLKSPYLPSQAELEDMTNNTAGILDLPPFAPLGYVTSIFDVYLEVQIDAVILHNQSPLTVIGIFSRTPPAPGQFFNAIAPATLCTEDDTPTRILIEQFTYYPVPYPTNAPIILNP